MEQLRVGLKKLGKQPFEGDVVHGGVRVEELEVDVNQALLRDGKRVRRADGEEMC